MFSENYSEHVLTTVIAKWNRMQVGFTKRFFEFCRTYIFVLYNLPCLQVLQGFATQKEE